MAGNETDLLLALYGTAVPPAPARAFAIGRLAFELIDGNLHAIRFDGAEVVRGIQYLVRDRDWGTLIPEIRDFRVEEGSDGLCITYAADCTGPDGDRLRYSARITARGDALDFTVEAEAIDDVTTSRLGFCVLHPAALAGAPLRVEHGDGSVEDACFPEAIDPWQPFTDIAALIHRQHGVTVACRLDGDSFEMEDQRNWSDASYKTYVRPLAKPWPYQVPAGTIDRQSVRLTFGGTASRPARGLGPIELEIGKPVEPMPRIGLVVTPDQAEAACAARTALCDSGVQDLLLSFAAQAGHGLAEMQALARVAEGLPHRRTLECVIAATGDLDAELRAIASHVARAGLRLDAVAVYPAPDLQSTPPGSIWPACPPVADIHAAARRAFPGLALGGGMFSYFTELNRKRPPLEQLDFVSHATCPIVHAADDLSVMQSLEAIPHILRSTRAIIGGDMPYRLGPVTIGMRQNPYGTRTMPNPARARIPMAMADPRQDGRFAAAWTIGYAAAVEGAGLDTLTLGALTGPLGVIGDAGPRPVFGAVRMLAGLAGSERRTCRTSEPDKVAAIAAGGTILLANLTAGMQAVRAAEAEIPLRPFEVIAIRGLVQQR